jgi:hypothetical protein
MIHHCIYSTFFSLDELIELLWQFFIAHNESILSVPQIFTVCPACAQIPISFTASRQHKQLATIADSDLCHRIIAESRGLTDFQSL